MKQESYQWHESQARRNPFLDRRFQFALLLLAISVIAVLSVVFITLRSDLNPDQGARRSSATLHVSYLEDVAGTMTLEEVRSISENSNAGSTRFRSGDDFRIGNSRSTWWARISTDDILAATDGKTGEYLSLLTSSVEQVKLYLPTQTGSVQDYRLFQAGWGILYDQHDDVGYSNPVFRITKPLPAGEYAYVRLNSPYTQNYTFKIYSDTAFDQVKMLQNTMVSLFIGFLLAICISNFIQFSTLGIHAHLYYILYLIMMILYQGTVLGYFRLYFGGIAESLVAAIAPIGMAMFTAALLFFRSALETKKNFPRSHKASNLVVLSFPVIVILFLAGFRYEANLLTLLLANLTSVLMLMTAYLAMRKKFGQAKYLFLGWLVILLVSLVFNGRAIGLLPNNELTTFIILFPTCIEAILLSLGISELMDQIRKERENALRQYHVAEGQVLTKESAFLQAQIRPHFLYNALNVIEALCYIDGKRAGGLIQELSKFLRHSFEFHNLEPFIRFKSELDFVSAYVKIEQARFRNKLSVVYDMDLEELDGLRLPPLLLQPLIENAIQHGIRKMDGKGTVTVRVRQNAEFWEISVEDDGAGMTQEQIKAVLSQESSERNSVGLFNIQKRLRMFYSTELQIESEPGKGTRVTVLLPKQQDGSPKQQNGPGVERV